MKTLYTLGLVTALSLAGCASAPSTPAPSEKEPQFAFTATVISAGKVNLGRGGATGSMPVIRLETMVQYVALGGDFLQPAQKAYVELAAGQNAPEIKQTCQFEAVNRHPVFAGGTLILDAKVSNCQ